MPYLLFYIEVVIGGILLSSAYSHSKNRYIFKNNIKSYKIIKSEKGVNLLSATIILLEFIIGICLVINYFKFEMLIGTILLFSVFNIAMLKSLLDGNSKINCGCGGILGDHLISWKLVVRNSSIIIILISDFIISFIPMDIQRSVNPIIFVVVYGTAILTLLVINTNSYINKIKSSLA